MLTSTSFTTPDIAKPDIPTVWKEIEKLLT